jgi:hypothetical protein
VVAGNVEHRHVEPADQVLEVVEGEVAAPQDELRPQGRQPVAVQRLVDLVGDGQDARCGR